GRDDIDYYQRLLRRSVDEDIARFVAIAVVGQFQLFSAALKRIGVSEGQGRQRPVRTVVAGKQLSGLLVRDDDRPFAKASSAADMIGMRMTVNDMGDWLVRHFSDRLRNQRGIGGRRVDHNNAALVH